MRPQYPQPARDKSGYLSSDTVAAIATSLGGPIAVIRISGPESSRALARLAGGDVSRFEPRKMIVTRLRSGSGEILDEAVAVRFVAPESFTGEDSVELHVHGGSFVAQRVMEELGSLGIRQALPGEFSFRAVRNGKMTLSQAEAVADLIASTNDRAVALALEKMSGTQNRLIAGLAESLRTLATLGEVGIDFADQDVEEVSLPNLKARIAPIAESLRMLAQSYSRGLRLQDGVRVAFVGIPNAGKSSFFNALLGEDRSIVSSVAGTTRDVIRERLTLRGKSSSITLRLEDTAGLRPTQDEVERIGIERTRRSVADSDLVLFIADPTAPFELAAAEWAAIGAPSGKTLGIITKCDLVEPARLEALRESLATLGIAVGATTSAMTGQGIPEAIDRIVDRCEKWVARGKDEVLLTRLDHQEAVMEALEHLSRAKEAAEIDLLASDLRQALVSLAPLIGETPPDDILGRVFSGFCIGK